MSNRGSVSAAERVRCKKERSLKRLLEHICAYCGYSKSDRPPLWCVRDHEVWSAKQDKLKAELWEAERD